ncbi:MAG: hypothetical protein OEV37_00840 [Candidatus Berkelbacteria bacterium]|nr:hypothetical protein [Candidatus Berkelbacteria bacterium]
MEENRVPGSAPKGLVGYKIAVIVLAVAVLAVSGVLVFVYLNRSSDSGAGTTATKTPTAEASSAAASGQSATVSVGSSASSRSTATVESSGEGTVGAASCTTYEYNLDESLCPSQPPERVCGVIRYVYDNGQEATLSSTFTNVCEYCSQFDASGFLELRGTKMYSKGYTMGQCQ